MLRVVKINGPLCIIAEHLFVCLSIHPTLFFQRASQKKIMKRKYVPLRERTMEIYGIFLILKLGTVFLPDIISPNLCGSGKVKSA
jgi:hypothetical protein